MITDSLDLIIEREASLLTLDHIYDNQTSFVDSVYLPEHEFNRFRSAIAAVRNLEVDLTDSIFNYYNFYFSAAPGLSEFGLAVDKEEPWYLRYKNDTFPTGYTPFDSLIIAHDIYPTAFYDFFDVFSYHVIDFGVDTFLNAFRLSELFDNLDGVRYTLPPSIFLDGNYIEGALSEGYVSLLYSVGQLDCPSGCLQRFFWEFRVYNDCSVEFLGNNPIITSTFELDEETKRRDVKVFPNPFRDNFRVATSGADFTYELSTIMGESVQKGSGKHLETIEVAQKHKAGVYLLKINVNGGFATIILIGAP